MPATLSLDRLRSELAASPEAILFEALPARHFLDGHIPGARHLPPDAVERVSGAQAPDRDARVIVYCSNEACRTSHVAAAALERLGYRNVGVFPGGKQAWVDAGLSLEAGGMPA